MSTYLEFIVLGFGLGVVYVGIGAGLLITYRATAIVNFAQAVLGAWGAFTYVHLRDSGEWVLPVGTIDLGGPMSTVPALLIGIVSAATMGVLAYVLALRPVRHAPDLAQVVSSIALLLTVTALELIRFGPVQVRVPSVVPDGHLTIGSARFPVQDLWFVVIMFACVLGMWLYLHYTRMGVATRASAENERAVLLMGYSTNRLAMIAMAVGSAVSALAIILGASITGLSVTNVSGFLVPAAAVFLLARMQSVWIVFFGGLAMGSLQSVLNFLVSTKTWWPEWASSGIDYALFFAIVVVILFVRGGALPGRGSLQTIRLPDVKVPSVKPWPILITGGVGLVALMALSGQYRLGLTNSLIMMLLCLSYVVITGYLGQVSLAQVAFAGAAGFLLSRLTMTWDISILLAMLIAAIGAVVLGLLVALPAFRIRGSELAIVTLAAAIAIERFVFNNPSFTPVEGNVVTSPTVLGVNLAPVAQGELYRIEFSIFVLVALILVMLVLVRILAGRTGRAFLAVRANERAAASVGINVRMTKAIGFAISAFLAGLAGTLIGFSQSQISSASFTYMVGLSLLAIAYLGGITTLSGAVVAGIIAPSGLFYVATHQWLDVGNYYALASGVLLIATVVLNPTGISGQTAIQLAWVREKWQERSASGPGEAEAEVVRQIEADRSEV